MLVIDEVVDWTVGAVFFGIVALYCFIIFLPGKCKRITGLIKTRHFVHFNRNMVKRYGIVKDEADCVELTASITKEMYKDTGNNATEGKTMNDMIKESMI